MGIPEPRIRRDRLHEKLDCLIHIAENEVTVANVPIEDADIRIVGTEPNCVLYIRDCLLWSTEPDQRATEDTQRARIIAVERHSRFHLGVSFRQSVFLHAEGPSVLCANELLGSCTRASKSNCSARDSSCCLALLHPPPIRPVRAVARPIRASIDRGSSPSACSKIRCVSWRFAIEDGRRYWAHPRMTRSPASGLTPRSCEIRRLTSRRNSTLSDWPRRPVISVCALARSWRSVSNRSAQMCEPVSASISCTLTCT